MNLPDNCAFPEYRAPDAHVCRPVPDSGLKVAAHAHGASGIADAIRAGIDSTNQTLSVISDSLQQGADQTAASSAQLSAASRALATGCSEQGASVTQTSASLEEISAMIRSTADNAAKGTARPPSHAATVQDCTTSSAYTLLAR